MNKFIKKKKISLNNKNNCIQTEYMYNLKKNNGKQMNYMYNS